MILHIGVSLVLVAIGFGLGRIKNLKGAEAKVSAIEATVKTDAAKVEADVKKL